MIELNLRAVNLAVQKIPMETGDDVLRILQVQDPDSGIVVQIPFPPDAWAAVKDAMDSNVQTATPADLAAIRKALPL